MLKVPEQGQKPDRSIGELIHQLIEDAKAYALAEIELIKAIAGAKATALVLPAGLLVGALLLGLAAINALAVGVVLALAKFVGPLLAGLIGLILLGAFGAVLAWVAVNRIRNIL
jgi:uncharacterized integral membrane protein